MIPQPLLEDTWYGFWKSVWERDVPYRDADDAAYFNTETGESLYLRHDATENETSQVCSQLDKDPDNWIEVPILTHREHYEIFHAFLRTLSPPNHGSLQHGLNWGFLKDARYYFDEEGDRIREDWHRFHERALRRRSARWFASIGWKVNWAKEGETD